MIQIGRLPRAVEALLALLPLLLIGAFGAFTGYASTNPPPSAANHAPATQASGDAGSVLSDAVVYSTARE